VAFRLGGKNILIERDETPDAFGSSFWLSPQSEWGWPPPKEIAAGRYGARTEGDALVLDSSTYPKLDISVTKRIRRDDKRDCFELHYTLYNRGAVPRKTAAWQNSRVRPGGLTFYPTGTPPLAASTLKLDASGAVTFFQHDKLVHRDGAKSFADGREGWLAHTDGELLFIKSFPDVPDGQQAPGEAEIELYVDGRGGSSKSSSKDRTSRSPPARTSTGTFAGSCAGSPPAWTRTRAAPRSSSSFARRSGNLSDRPLDDRSE